MIKAIIFDCFGVLIGEGLWNTFVRAGGDLKKDGLFLDEQIKLMNSGEIRSIEFHHRIARHLGLTYEYWNRINNEGESPNTELLTWIEEKARPSYKTALLSNARYVTLPIQ